jgi:hypothetical protein
MQVNSKRIGETEYSSWFYITGAGSDTMELTPEIFSLKNRGGRKDTHGIVAPVKGRTESLPVRPNSKNIKGK